MQSEETEGDVGASRAISGESRLSRREAIGRMSVFAPVGAAAWVVPEILTAKPAGGATLSAPGVVTGAGTLNGTPPATLSKLATTPSSSDGPPLAFTGLNIQRDAEVGAALLAGGWAMHHWATRMSTPSVEDPGTPA